MTRLTRRFPKVLLLLTLSACGGGAGPTPDSDSGPRTSTFTGTARIANNGACSSLTPSNEFSAGAGTITVTLVQAGAPRMQVQVCATSETNHTNCTVPPFALLSIGQSISATLKGGRTQAVTLYPEGCGGPDTPPGEPLSYTVSVVHPG